MTFWDFCDKNAHGLLASLIILIATIGVAAMTVVAIIFGH